MTERNVLRYLVIAPGDSEIIGGFAGDFPTVTEAMSKKAEQGGNSFVWDNKEKREVK